jgi:hypothetical protein
MQTKSILANADKEFCVVGHGRSVRLVDRTVSRMQRRYSAQIKLVNTDRYEKTHWWTNDINEISRFKVVTDPKERSYGYLVTDGTTYKVAPANEFVALWSEMETHWSKAEAEELLRKQQYEAERTQRDAVVKVADERATKMKENVEKSLAVLFGKDRASRISINTNVDTNIVDGKFVAVATGRVWMELSDLEGMIEMILEARDAVA